MGRALCVSVLALVSCGRVDFDPPGDGGTDAGPSAPIAWVKVFAAHSAMPGSGIDQFQAAAARAGDAIVVHVYCTSNSAPTGVTLVAPNWTFTEVGSFSGSMTDTDYIASFAAIAQDTTTATFDVSWAGNPHCNFVDELGDEFANADATGGTTTFDAHDEALGATGDCGATLTPGRAGDMVWAACSGQVSMVGMGYMKGADDGNTDWTEYRLAGGTGAQQVSFTNAGTSWAMTAVAIKPR